MTQFDTSTAGVNGTLAGSGPGGSVTPADIERIQREAEGNEGIPQTAAEQAEQDNDETPDAPLGAFSEGDTLALLSQRAQAVQAAAAPRHTIYGFNREFAIVCEAAIAERQIRNWQRRALPQGKRKAQANQISMFDMDQRRVALACLHETAIELWVLRGRDRRGNDQWAQVPIKDSSNGSIFDDAGVRQAFGVIDRDSVLNRIFGGSDGPLIRAGNEIMGAAGWVDGVTTGTDDDDIDEYDELDPRRGR